MQELAWSSFALLKNTNSIGMLVQRGPHTLLARGALGSSTVLPGGTDPSLVGISKVGRSNHLHQSMPVTFVVCRW